MQEELSTVLVSVNVDDSDEARIQKIENHVGEGWEVIQAIPVSGGGVGPGGASEGFLRMQVTVRRTIDADGVIQGADRTGASELPTQPATAAFDPPNESDPDSTPEN
jgi:hypothetical protein